MRHIYLEESMIFIIWWLFVVCYEDNIYPPAVCFSVVKLTIPVLKFRMYGLLLSVLFQNCCCILHLLLNQYRFLSFHLVPHTRVLVRYHLNTQCSIFWPTYSEHSPDLASSSGFNLTSFSLLSCVTGCDSHTKPQRRFQEVVQVHHTCPLQTGRAPSATHQLRLSPLKIRWKLWYFCVTLPKTSRGWAGDCLFGTDWKEIPNIPPL